MTKNNKLFVLEDNKELLSEIAEMAADLNWDVRHARCVSQAVELAHSLPKPTEGKVCLALIDLMLPFTFEQLTELDELQKRREALVMQFMQGAYETSLSPKSAREARAKLDVIDDQIRRMIKVDGGLSFLRECPAFATHWKVAVFSARDHQKFRPEIDQLLHPNGLIDWIQKPVPPNRIERILKMFTERSG